jgi:hypothetical protein
MYVMSNQMMRCIVALVAVVTVVAVVAVVAVVGGWWLVVVGVGVGVRACAFLC